MTRVVRVGAPGTAAFGYTVVDDDYSVIEPIERYLTWLHNIGRSPNTVRAYAQALHFFWDYLTARGITWDEPHGMLEHLGAWMAHLSRGDTNVIVIGQPPARSKSTISAYLGAVYGFYQFHQRHGVHVIDTLVTTDGRPSAYRNFLAGLATGPTTRRLVGPRVPRRRVRTLTPSQTARIIAVQQHLRDQFLFTLLLVTGMRIGQALGLRHEDLDIDRQEVRIVGREDNVNLARGKGTPGSVLGVSPVPARLIDLYVRYLHEEYGDLDSDYVFVNLWGGLVGSPMTYNTVNDLVRRTRQKVGFDFTVHQFRHTFATQCLEAGMSPEVLSKLLTHKSVATTADIYAHLSPEHLRGRLVESGMLTGGTDA